MSQLRKILGVVWMLLGPATIYFLVSQAAYKISQPSSTTNDLLQWGIIITIFVPIAIGLMIFGYYAVKGEYAEIED